VTNPYDLVRYPNTVFIHTHPIALGALAALFGKKVTPFAASRVLEIGCGEGVNLLSMALAAPRAEFVGVDLAEGPIGLARTAAQACGLANASFHVQDILNMDASIGRFDYIIAHGVYAWTPPPVRAALMRIAGALLSADGLAMISYNVNPGSRLRHALRDILVTFTAGVESPSEKLRVARASLTGLAARWSEAEPIEHAMILEARRVLDRSFDVLFHDELGAFYEPQILSNVVAAAREAGLDYLCDARAEMCEQAFFPSEKYAAERAEAAGDWVRFEQLFDFREMCAFRNSIFCRGDGDRRFEAQRLRGLRASGAVQAIALNPQEPDSFSFRLTAGVDITTTSRDLAQFLASVIAAFPSDVALDAAAENEGLAEQVMRLFFRNIIYICNASLPIAHVPGERPAASPLARFQASRGERALTTLRHTSIKVEDAFALSFVTLLDGTRTRLDLAHEISTRVGQPPEAATALVSAALKDLTRLGLMMA